MNLLRPGAGLAAAILFAAPVVAQDVADLRFPVLAPAAPAGAGVTESCAPAGVEGPVRCGVFRVYEDRKAASGRTVDIHFVVLGALDPSRRATDAVVHLSGGPGASTIDAVLPRAGDNRAFRGSRDVLLVDLRGIGRSGGLDCDVPYPEGVRSRFNRVFSIEHVSRCRDHLGARAALDQYTTATTVHDLEELRRWLGYSGVDLISASYGTRVVQTYMRLYPAAVRVAVMVGVAPLDRPVYLATAANAQRALDQLVDRCEGDSACSRAHPRFRSRLADLFGRLREGSLSVETGGQRVPFTGGDLAYAVRGILYGSARDLPRLVEQASQGDLSGLVDVYLARTNFIGRRGGGAGNHFSVLCAEDIANISDADVARATAGTFLGAHLIDNYREVCRIWPAARLAAAELSPVRSDVPTLLLSGERDPVTPPSGGEAVARGLSRSLHVVVPNAGHWIGGPCVGAMILRLVEDGALDRVDRSCIGN